MPDIFAAGTFDVDTSAAWRRTLESKKGNPRTLLFGGVSVGTTTEIQYETDGGTWATLEDGDITSLPRSIVLDALAMDVRIVSTGSPILNVTFGGTDR